ncbi:hypothetical protein [Vibrio vulnificus YJ016]|uniref:Uncharacterized protein n=1 Tax=Vibrio vulnificus (strain YJ016) TaxID=196600 RepID=Q7ME56_VIBVY|nr:hypothetical protein [Vibrio vulnificus YJ016]
MAGQGQVMVDLMKDLRDNPKYKTMPNDELQQVAKALAKRVVKRQLEMIQSGTNYLMAESEAYREALMSA